MNRRYIIFALLISVVFSSLTMINVGENIWSPVSIFFFVAFIIPSFYVVVIFHELGKGVAKEIRWFKENKKHHAREEHLKKYYWKPLWRLFLAICVIYTILQFYI
jgi:hypothetical protein